MEKHDISLKILHEAGLETARQAATLAERHAVTIAPCRFRIHLLACVYKMQVKVIIERVLLRTTRFFCYDEKRCSINVV